jgi:transposase InsO family protein
MKEIPGPSGGGDLEAFHTRCVLSRGKHANVACWQILLQKSVERGLDRDRPTSPRSPWQNGYAERLIGSIRRECLDHIVVFSERHLRHLLLSYMKYYNGTRTHLSLEKDAPVSRAVDRAEHIRCRPTLWADCITNMPGFNLQQAQPHPGVTATRC